MPKKRESDDRLVLVLDGTRLPAEQFKRTFDAFLTLLQEVASEVMGSASAIRWVLSVEPGSVRLRFRPQARRAGVPTAIVVKAVRDGVRSLERTAKRPRYFSDTALREAKIIADAPISKDFARPRIEVESAAGPAKPIKLEVSTRTSHHVEEILGPRIRDLGAIEGRLLMVSLRKTMHVGVYDSLTDKAVICYFGSDEAFDEAHRALGKRVNVSGMVRYSKFGQPISIEVEALRVLGDEHELPTIDDVYGILSTDE